MGHRKPEDVGGGAAADDAAVSAGAELKLGWSELENENRPVKNIIS